MSDQAVSRNYFRRIAEQLGLPYCDRIDGERLAMRNSDILAAIAAPHGPKIVQYHSPGARTIVLISPARFEMSEMAAYLRRYPDLAGRMMVVDPLELRRALIERAGPLLAARAQRELELRHPDYSASVVANGRQGFIFGMLSVALLCGLAFMPATVVLGLHWFAVLFFLACIVLRMMAACRTRPERPRLPLERDDRQLPVYSVLVALYRESEVVGQLVDALDRLDWPRSKLEIKLVCEADDTETLAAIARLHLPANFEVLIVPPAGPRTKPKALAFALPAICGDFVVVFDAEDIPHPAQLREAWHAFKNAGPDLACVQAPLTIANARQNLLTRMFAFEYAALFRGLLPALADWRCYLPLGGTSNHFRVEILRTAGGWDPFNVTEDADLALRLCRHGYRIDTITLPTYEDAPDRLKTWFHQRSRWFKGWMQTLLVHWRKPGLLFRQLRPGSLTIAHILLFGICLSSLAYLFLPAFFAAMLYKAYHAGGLSFSGKALLTFDALSMTLAYVAFLLLGWRASGRAERPGTWKVVLFLPAYWILLSLASWHALYKVITDPFHWAKTPHGSSVLRRRTECERITVTGS